MSLKSSLAFHKIVGTGNDFLFIDLRAPKTFSVSRKELAKRIADRHFGVGSDGVVFIEKNSGDPELKWDFYNPDGSSAAMCGNALRCMGRWAEEVLGTDRVRFLTLRGVITVAKVDAGFAAELSGIKIEPKTLRYELEGRPQEALLVDTGVPHAVVRVNSISDPKELFRHVPHLRFHKDAGSEGANVTFLEAVGASNFKTVSFERGVENFTLSCGTGVLAAAAVGLGVGDAHAKLVTPGGPLEVVYKNNFAIAQLIGPAEMICAGSLEERFLK